MSGPVPVNPASLAPPVGFSHGMRGRGELLFVAGQIGIDAAGAMVPGGFVPQFVRALDNVLTVVREAGGTPQAIARMVVYVTDKREYMARRKEIGLAWRERLGRHFPAMVLVEVKGLLEGTAQVEIEAVALL